ncbi:hypothetical protein [Spartinivicinus poritis]|uniref:Uncharacterized protein n=1 Tax=Spartinivicinus poritis TaxID=2994640 RepID=A0ABT5U889_9GAMM|nr:hypothetical protein [Spartinivicinus sp. A2-2]MDE1462581.1 hypothetical protein [Spartinivicinus sp. A2-2]
MSNTRIKSIQALETLLLNIVNDPKAFLKEKGCIAALKSQRKLSAYQNDDLAIYPCALNTLKANADQLLSRGYSGLDGLRLHALEAIESAKQIETRGNKTTKKGAINLLKEKEAEIVLLQQQNMHLVLICQELKRIAHTYASSGDEKIQALYKKDMKRINSLLSLSHPTHTL